MKKLYNEIRNRFYQVLAAFYGYAVAPAISGGSGGFDVVQTQTYWAGIISTAGALTVSKGGLSSTIGGAVSAVATATGETTLTFPAPGIPADSTLCSITVYAADGTTVATCGFGQISHTSDTVKIISTFNAAATPALAALKCSVKIERIL